MVINFSGTLYDGVCFVGKEEYVTAEDSEAADLPP